MTNYPQLPAWHAALSLLQHTIKDATDFKPDNLGQLADKQGSAVSWESIGSTEEGDEVVWSRLRPLLGGVDGNETVIIVADPLYRDREDPLRTTWNELDDLISDVGAKYYDQLLNGDAILISARRVLILHHGGLATVVHPCE